LFFKPLGYQNKILISVSGEPNKKAINEILNAANRQKGVVAFNFHPDHLYKGDKNFKRNMESFKYLIKKLR